MIVRHPPPSFPNFWLPSQITIWYLLRVNLGNLDIIEAVMDNLPVGVFVKDASNDFRFVVWNKKQEEITQLPAATALGKTDEELFSKEAADVFHAMDKEVLDSGMLKKIPQESIRTKAGKRYLRTLKLPMNDPTTGRILLLGISEDITESVETQKELERLNERFDATNQELQETQNQLFQAEKLDSIGRLAAGVAHEVKNPLAMLLLGIDYLDGGVSEDDENIPVILKQMREGVTRADSIVRGLVDFSSQSALNRKKSRIRDVFNNTLLLVKHELVRSNVKLRLGIVDNLPSVYLDVPKFEQVLINLILNAIQAMADREQRELTITAQTEKLQNVDPDEGARTLRIFRDNDIVVVVRIQDNGTGIDPENIDKIFDPFFTTKATGDGTGLGLSITRKIVELHDGKLQLKNRADGADGTIAEITLPTRLANTAHIKSPKLKQDNPN